METFFFDLGVCIALYVIIFTLNALFPSFSFNYKVEGVIWFCGMIFFANQLRLNANELNLEDPDVTPFVCSLVSLVVSTAFFTRCAKDIPFKTSTQVVSKITGHVVGVVTPGASGYNASWNKLSRLINLKDDIREIPKTDPLLTATKILAVIKKIKITIYSTANSNKQDIRKVFTVEGEETEIIKQILDFIEEALIRLVGQIEAEKLDTDKAGILEKLTENLEHDVNEFCLVKDYPYRVKNTVIGDTELETKYYEALRKRVLAALEQDAEDEIAKRIQKRLSEFGDKLYKGTGSPKDQVREAMIALKITPKTIDEKTTLWGVADAKMEKLLTDIAAILAAAIKK